MSVWQPHWEQMWKLSEMSPAIIESGDIWRFDYNATWVSFGEGAVMKRVSLTMTKPAFCGTTTNILLKCRIGFSLVALWKWVNQEMCPGLKKEWLAFLGKSLSRWRPLGCWWSEECPEWRTLCHVPFLEAGPERTWSGASLFEAAWVSEHRPELCTDSATRGDSQSAYWLRQHNYELSKQAIYAVKSLPSTPMNRHMWGIGAAHWHNCFLVVGVWERQTTFSIVAVEILSEEIDDQRLLGALFNSHCGNRWRESRNVVVSNHGNDLGNVIAVLKKCYAVSLKGKHELSVQYQCL